VYFIQAAESRYIKIGSARNPIKRLAALQTANWEELQLIGIDPAGSERQYHKRFARLRFKGEWFFPRRQLLALIKRFQVSTVRKDRVPGFVNCSHCGDRGHNRRWHFSIAKTA
jgi:hypothetical protein